MDQPLSLGSQALVTFLGLPPSPGYVQVNSPHRPLLKSLMLETSGAWWPWVRALPCSSDAVQDSWPLSL